MESSDHPAVKALASSNRELFVVESDSSTEPLRGPCFIDLASCDRQHGALGIVGVGRIGRPGAVVQVYEHDECSPGSALVSVRERMIPRQPTRRELLPCRRCRGRTLRRRSQPEAHGALNRPDLISRLWPVRWRRFQLLVRPTRSTHPELDNASLGETF